MVLASWYSYLTHLVIHDIESSILGRSEAAAVTGSHISAFFVINSAFISSHVVRTQKLISCFFA